MRLTVISIKKNNKVVLVSKDIEIIQKFKSDIKSGHKLCTREYLDKRTNKKYTSYVISITNEIFTKNLINNGITNNKTDFLIFPDIKENLYSYFIAGLFDGDGSVGKIGKDKNRIRISLISTIEVLTFIQKYLKISNVKLQKVSKNKPNVWRMHLYKDASIFLDFIYQDFNFNYLQRKFLFLYCRK